jgi:hypothetical protein
MRENGVAAGVMALTRVRVRVTGGTEGLTGIVTTGPFVDKGSKSPSTSSPEGGERKLREAGPAESDSRRLNARFERIREPLTAALAGSESEKRSGWGTVETAAEGNPSPATSGLET